jgi:hypothetical protein
MLAIIRSPEICLGTTCEKYLQQCECWVVTKVKRPDPRAPACDRIEVARARIAATWR